MNPDTNQSTAFLLKAILTIQIVMLILFACSYIAGSSSRAEYKKQMEEYRTEEAEYEKVVADYQKQMATYKAQLEAWQTENAAYTNRVHWSPK